MATWTLKVSGYTIYMYVVFAFIFIGWLSSCNFWIYDSMYVVFALIFNGKLSYGNFWIYDYMYVIFASLVFRANRSFFAQK